MRTILCWTSVVLLTVAMTTPSHAVDKTTTAGQATAKTLQAGKLKGGLKATGGTTGGTVGGGATVAELSAYECRTLGGTVVVVADDRCGASRKYCRMPDTLAACIDEIGD